MPLQLNGNPLDEEQEKLQRKELAESGSFQRGVTETSSAQEIGQNAESQNRIDAPGLFNAVNSRSNGPDSDIPEIKAPEINNIDPIAPDINLGSSQTPNHQGITGIDPTLDKELGDLKVEKESAIQDTFDSFNISKGLFQEQKGFYKNFDSVNSRFEGVLSDLRNAQGQSGAELTDEQYEAIGRKYGLTPDQVKNPQSIFEGLEFTDEGKDKFGVNAGNKNIDDLTTDFERRKEDLKFQLEGQKQRGQQQIDDVGSQLQENIEFLRAQGAWNGSARSSGYLEGIQNIKDDHNTTVDRLGLLSERTDQAYETNIKRLTEDYDSAREQANQDLQGQIKDLKFSTGLSLNGLTDKYGAGSEELTNALDKINEEFGAKSLDTFSKYISNVRSIQQITNDNIKAQDDLEQRLKEQSDERYNELTDNNGLLLTNTSLNSLVDSVKSGDISVKRFNDLKNIITTSITGTLGNITPLNSGDLQTIDTLLGQGLTPTEIVGRFQETERFKPQVSYIKRNTTKIQDGETLIDSDTGEVIHQGSTSSNFAGTSTTDFIARQEGFRTEAYLDSAGVPTIGYGFTNINGRPVSLGDTISQGDADVEFEKQISQYQGFLDKVTVPLSEDQITALTSFEYNLGRGIWDTTAGGVIDAINSGDIEAAQDLILKHNKARDPQSGELRELKGLSRRRQEEVGLLGNVGSDNNSEKDVEKLKFAQSLTASGRKEYLDDEGLTDKYIDYVSKQGTEQADFSDITSINDVVFADGTNESTKQSFGFGVRQDNANNFITQFEEKLLKSGTFSENLAPRGDFIPGFLKTEDRKRFEQAQRNFVNATLRVESGAAIAESEFNSAAKQYFPSPGDSKSVIEQKRQNRNTVIENMFRSAGKDAQGRNIIHIYKSIQGEEEGELVEYKDRVKNYSSAVDVSNTQSSLNYLSKFNQ